ncbi:hypothetical protein IFR05_009241 [Cadophora sp. M221]|nr:hypothetical protein IFR05_009241 [Cadophora sp. M221]
MASERSQSPPRRQISVQRVGPTAGGSLSRSGFVRRNGHLRTPTLGNPVPSPTVMGSPPPTPTSQQKPNVDRACSCRIQWDEKNKRGGPPSPGAAGLCTCEIKGAEGPRRSDSGIDMKIRTSGSSRLAALFGMREWPPTGNGPRIKRKEEREMHSTRVRLPKMCVPLSEVSWRSDGSLHFSKKATKKIREMMPANKPAGVLNPRPPVKDLKTRQSSRPFKKWMKKAFRRIKNPTRNRDRDQDRKQRFKNLGKRYLLPNWGEKRPKVKIGLWIARIKLRQDYVDWNDDCLTIHGKSAMRVLQRAAIVIDKDHGILQDNYALSSWPKRGKITVKKEGADFDILINHLQRGRRIWVSRTKNRKSVIDIPRTERLWDARTLAYASHYHTSAHMPLIRICQGYEPKSWSATTRSGPKMARGKMAGALQELSEKRREEAKCDGFLEMTTQLERIIRKGMDEDIPCARCRHNRIFTNPRMRRSSLEDDCVRELPAWDTASENPEAVCFDQDDPGLDSDGMDILAKKNLPGPNRYVDRDPKRKNKKTCFRDCYSKACTKKCGIDPNKIQKSWFWRTPKSKPEPPAEEKKPDIDISKPRQLIRTRPCTAGWEVHYYSSIECNEPSWEGFRCTVKECPKSYPGCPHAEFVKPGQSSKGANDLFKEHHRSEGLICWKDLPRIPFKENKDLSGEENKRLRMAYEENLRRTYEEFRNTPAPPSPPAEPAKPRRSKNQPRKVTPTSSSTLTPARDGDESDSDDTIKTSSVKTIKGQIRR